METGQHVERIMGKIEACLSSLEGQSCLFSANSSFPSINLPINLALFFFLPPLRTEANLANARVLSSLGRGQGKGCQEK